MQHVICLTLMIYLKPKFQVPVLESQFHFSPVERHDCHSVWLFGLDMFVPSVLAEVLLTKITPLKEKVEIIEGGDAMEEESSLAVGDG